MGPKIIFCVGAALLTIASFVVEPQAVKLLAGAILSLAVAVAWPTTG